MASAVGCMIANGTVDEVQLTAATLDLGFGPGVVLQREDEKRPFKTANVAIPVFAVHHLVEHHEHGFLFSGFDHATTPRTRVSMPVRTRTG